MEKENQRKWLKMLFYIHIINLVFSAVSFLPINDQWTTWVGWVLAVLSAWSLFFLAPVNERYRKAALFQGSFVACSVINAVLFSSQILVLGGSVCSIIALYQEYNGHGASIQDRDPQLSRSWHSLFIWSLIAGVLVAVGSMATAMAMIMAGAGDARTAAVILMILSVPGTVLQIVYLVYLNRMLRLITAE